MEPRLSGPIEAETGRTDQESLDQRDPSVQKLKSGTSFNRSPIILGFDLTGVLITLPIIQNYRYFILRRVKIELIDTRIAKRT